MKRNLFILLLLTITYFQIPTLAFAHCEIPCGIYEDQGEFDAIRLDIATIEKAMNKITELSSEAEPNYNQIVRWVQNKDDHAENIKEVVSHYFLSQRVKLDEENQDEYQQKLAYIHQISVYAMKAKQTTDLEYISKLMDSVNEFEKLYFKHSH